MEAAAASWRFGWSSDLPASLVFGAVTATVTTTDVAARGIPNRVVAPVYVPALLMVASARSRLCPAYDPESVAVSVRHSFVTLDGLSAEP